MSFILDALRKSDAERQRSATPGLADIRYRPPHRRREVWLPVLAVVLAANAVILAFLWLRPDAAPPPAAPAPAAPSAEAPAPAYPDVRPLAQEADLEPLEPEGLAPEPNVVVEMAESPAGPGPVPLDSAPPAATPPPAAPSPAPASPAASRAGLDLPTADQLISSGQLSTPALNLDLHVYASTPEGRFVVINSRRYKEGARLQEGPGVEAITPEGVILENQGSRFLLPRK